MTQALVSQLMHAETTKPLRACEGSGGGSYETWFGEHSYLSTKAGEIIELESVGILNRLRLAP